MSFKDLKNLPPPPIPKRVRQCGEPKVFPYDIIEVMEDPEYMKHFLRRFEIAVQCVRGRGKQGQNVSWYLVYKDNPMLLYYDAMDNIKVMLKRQESSAAILPLHQTLHHIVLKAVDDWICEKEGLIPKQEIFPDFVHILPIPYEKYYVNKEEPRPRG